jgi:uracil-DNA glycosylase family 4
MLRELNLYPQWIRRNQPVPVAEQPAPMVGNPLLAGANVELTPLVVTEQPAPIGAEVEMSIPASAMAAGPVEPAVTGQTFLKPSHVAGLDWISLNQQVRDCTACKLRAGCKQTVFGVGDEQADWLFVGEGPGADEDVQGEPFVGQAGKLLDNMLMAIKLKRGKSVYIANVVKCRPPGNRAPDADEIVTCLPYLRRQIELIQPKLIVALGKIASNALLSKETTLASLRGKIHDYRGIPVIVTFHPAYLLRTPSEKAKAWQDLLLALRARHGEA